jgi:hypothetical protein
MSPASPAAPTWREVIPDGEAARFEAYATELRELQRARTVGQDPFRALHTKAHVAAVGELIVDALPAELAAGAFAAPRKWPVYVRFSNGQIGRHKDTRPDIRGIAIKLVGVPGPKLIPGLESALTQDFLFIQLASIATKNPDEFLALVRAGKKGNALLLPRLIGALGFRRAFAIVRAFLSLPKVPSMATVPFYTAAPLRLGDHAVKLALFPEDANQPPGGAAATSPREPGNRLGEDLVARLQAGPLAWSLRAQRFIDDATTPIEDVSVRWPEDKAPFTPLARLVLPRQDPTGPAGQAVGTLVERLSFDPWHALPEHRPLGAVMRARAAAYRESVLERGAAPEPTEVLPPG